MPRTKQDYAALVARLKAVADSADPELVAGHVLLESFSARNAILILSQLPNATACAGFKAWQAAGRSVAKGERGLAILAPTKITTDSGEELKRFRVVYVFDVSQTVPLNADQGLAPELVGV